MSLLHWLSYVGIVVAAAFVILSLASGLLWISELIEEHSRTAKTIGIRAVYAIIILHILLYFSDSLPLLHVLLSITAHIVYLQNFSHTWPCISLTSLAFISSCVLAILNHFAWFFYFSRVSREAAQSSASRARGGTSWSGHGRSSVHVPKWGDAYSKEVTVPGFPDIATFFALCVWFVPLFLFLSLSANDNALPVSGFDSPTVTHAPSQAGRSSLFKSILDFFPFLRRRRDRTDGILVTHTPTSSAPTTPRTSYSGQNPYTAASQASFEIQYPPSPNLKPPPKRSMTGPPRAGASSPRIPEDEVAASSSTLSARSPSLLVSRSGSTIDGDSPVRRRAVAE